MPARARSLHALVKQWPGVVARSIMGASGHGTFPPGENPAPDWAQWEQSPFAACWIGHATCLLRVGGITILTDPHFGASSGIRLVGREVGRPRAAPLPLDLSQLPNIDLILLSHAHLDHWHRPTLAALARRGRPPTVVVPRRTARLLPRGFSRVIELPWQHEATAHDLRVTAIKPRHWGARWLVDLGRGYNSYLIEAGGARVLFGGDTAETAAFDQLAAHPGGVDLAVLGIGTYRNWEHTHATPEQAAGMAQRMGARLLMPIHHATFPVNDEPAHEPLERLRRAWPVDRIVCPRAGECWAWERGTQAARPLS